MGTSISGLGLAQWSAVEVVLPPVETESRPRLWLYPDAAGRRAASVLALVATPTGRLIGELRGEMTGVAWKLNSYGPARLNLFRGTTAEHLARPGNRLAILFDNGLPPWGGVIDLPRPWRGPVFELTAYSAEVMLAWRGAGGERTLTGTAGAVLAQLLTEAGREAGLGIELGDIWTGGKARQWEFVAETLAEAAAELTSGTGDYFVEPVVMGGTLRFLLHFLERRGSDRSKRVALTEGHNLVRPELNEQGPLVNQWRVEGAGLGGTVLGPQQRYVGAAGDAESQELYGRREDSETNSALTSQEMVDYQAAVNLAATSQPQEVIGVEALDRPPGRFEAYDVGDTLWFELFSQGYGGFAGPRRVTAREYLPQTNVCRLVVI